MRTPKHWKWTPHHYSGNRKNHTNSWGFCNLFFHRARFNIINPSFQETWSTRFCKRDCGRHMKGERRWNTQLTHTDRWTWYHTQRWQRVGGGGGAQQQFHKLTSIGILIHADCSYITTAGQGRPRPRSLPFRTGILLRCRCRCHRHHSGWVVIRDRVFPSVARRLSRAYGMSQSIA